MKYMSYGYRLPNIISARLFGDRKQFGLRPVEDDPCWLEWRKECHSFYTETQKNGVGAIVNNAGYEILQAISLDGLKVLEVGPGGLFHIKYWNGSPEHYVLVDLDEKFLNIASKKLSQCNISYEERITTRDAHGVLPSDDNEFDLIITFYSLEHLYPFSSHLTEMLRVLKPEGRIIGAIPTEGGLAWGLGRYLTSRRWLKTHTNINPDKIICWEHPTMAEEIISCMLERMTNEKLMFWPFRIPMLDFNLVVKFIFTKNDDQ